MSDATVFQAGGNMGGDVDVEGNEVLSGYYYVEYEGRCVSGPFLDLDKAEASALRVQHAHEMAEATDEEYDDLDIWKYVNQAVGS